jgi:hypothetical protein
MRVRENRRRVTSRGDAARPSSAVLREVVRFPTPASHRPTVIDGPLQPQIGGSRTRRLHSSGPREVGLESRKRSAHGRPPGPRQSGRLRLSGLRRPFVTTVVMKEMSYEESYGLPHAAIFIAVKTLGEAAGRTSCRPTPARLPVRWPSPYSEGGRLEYAYAFLAGRLSEGRNANGGVRDEHPTGERFSSKLQHRAPLKVPSSCRDLSHVRKTLESGVPVLPAASVSRSWWAVACVLRGSLAYRGPMWTASAVSHLFDCRRLTRHCQANRTHFPKKRSPFLQ